MKKQQKTVLVLALVLVFLSGLSYSQSKETCALEGKVTDSEGIPLPGAEVKLSSPQMIGGDRSQVTGAEGKFRFVGRQPGVYSLEASLVGFAPQRRENFRLSVGQTLTVDFALEIGRIEEEITVLGVAPLIDVKDSSIATRVLDERSLKNVIFDTNTREMYIYSVIDLAAGSTPTYHGSSAFGGAARTGNSYLMDGVEISESRSGQTWAIPDPNIFEEARVQGLGAAAEYDGFQGVVLSMVTKSGGNTFDGMGLIVYTDYDWESSDHIDVADPMFSLYSEPDGHSYTEARFGIGGPLIVDKLWFYGAISYLKHGFSRVSTAGVESKWTKETPRWFMKLTFQPTQSTRLQLFTDLDDFIYDYRYQTVYRPEIASSFEHCYTYIHNLTAFHSLSDKTFVEFKIARAHNTDEYGGMIDDYKNVSGRHNDRTGMYSVNYSYWDDYVDYRFQVNTSLSHHADDFIQGSHDFKLGVEFEQIGLEETSDYNGGYFYEDEVYSWADNEFHTYAYSEGPDVRNPRGRRYSIYVQDSWKVMDNLTINPGIRYNVYNGYLGTVGETLFKTSGLAPRIGITWDIFGDHKTALKVHYGRFFDKFNHNKFDAASAGLKDWVKYEVNPDGTKTEVDRTVRSNPADVDPDLKYPHVDQFTIGIERELMKDISAGFSFVYKTWKNSISKIDIGRSYALTDFTFEDLQGVEHTYEIYQRSGTSSYFMTNPAPGAVTWVGTRPDMVREPKSDYVGLIFTFEKRFSNKWMVAGSYSHSRRRSWPSGTNPNSELAFQRWGGKPIAYWYPNFKVYGSFILPLDITISPTFEYRGGPRWESYIRAPVGGSPSVDIEKPGSNQLPHTINFDVRAEKILTVKDDLRLGLYMDMYNPFNFGRETSIESRITRASYGLATDVNLGRMFRVGLRVYF